jgi:GNAT superfamily N-acetyltransferase
VSEATRVEVHPLTRERWEDFEKLFGPRGAFSGCWCMWPRLRSKDYQQRKNPENQTAMRALVDDGEVPGLLAYVNGEVAGWVSLDKRERLLHFEYSRKLKTLERPDGLWSIVCFVIDKHYRRQGLMTRLLEAASEYAARHGAKVLEAYPIELEGGLKSYKGFSGIASTFRRAGFAKVGGTTTSLVMRKVIK